MLGRVLVLPPPASAKAVNLTDDSSWQNSAHPRKRSTFGKQRGQEDAGTWLSMASHPPENPSFGGQPAARAVCGTAFQQTLSWMNRESCVLSDTKACIVLLVWASCLKDLEHFACVLLPAMPQDKAAPLLQLSIPQQSSPHRFLRVTIPLYRFKSLQHDQKCILSLPSMGN